jgi:hypothetical protein
MLTVVMGLLENKDVSVCRSEAFEVVTMVEVLEEVADLAMNDGSFPPEAISDEVASSTSFGNDEVAVNDIDLSGGRVFVPV